MGALGSTTCSYDGGGIFTSGCWRGVRDSGGMREESLARRKARCWVGSMDERERMCGGVLLKVCCLVGLWVDEMTVEFRGDVGEG